VDIDVLRARLQSLNMLQTIREGRVPRGLALLWVLLPAVLGAPSPQHSTLQQRADLPEGYYAPPYYPTPPGGWVDEWADSYAKAAEMVRNMTLAEKVNLTTGAGFEMGKF
jgi:beta-glucosidase